MSHLSDSIKATVPSSVFSLPKNETAQAISNLPAPFIHDGRLDAVVVLGRDPIPSSDEFQKAISEKEKLLMTRNLLDLWVENAHISDGIAAAFISFYLARHLAKESHALDVIISNWIEQKKEKLVAHNVVAIGSPQVNDCTGAINEKFGSSNLRFLMSGQNVRAMQILGTEYGKGSDHHLGIVWLTRNPYNELKSALVVAGMSGPGTWAAACALQSEKLINDMKSNFLVVKAIDKDGDRIYDDYERV